MTMQRKSAGKFKKLMIFKQVIPIIHIFVLFNQHLKGYTHQYMTIKCLVLNITFLV